MKSYTFLRNKLWAKVAGATTTVIAVVIALVTVFNLNGQKRLIESLTTYQNHILADTIKSAIIEPLANGDSDTVKRQIEVISSSNKNVDIFIYDYKGIVTFSTSPQLIEHHVTNAFHSEEIRNETAIVLSSGVKPEKYLDYESGGKHYSTMIVPVLNDRRCFHCHGKTRKVLGGYTIVSSAENTINSVNESRKRSIIIATLGLCTLIVVIFTMFGIHVNRRLSSILSFTDNLLSGDLQTKSDIKGSDEIAKIGDSVNKFSAELSSLFTNILEESNKITNLSSELEGVYEQINSNVEETTDSSVTVTKTADKIKRSMNSTTTAIESASDITLALADKIGTLNESISQISSAAKTSGKITKEARYSMEETAQIIKGLGKDIGEIDSVTESIKSVADQVKLISLNVAVDKSGGKDFISKSALNLKELSSLSEKAAEEAETKLSEVINKSGEAIEAFKSVTENFLHAESSVNSIMSEVEKQSATTYETADNLNKISIELSKLNHYLQEGVEFSDLVSKDVETLSKITENLSVKSNQVKHSAGTLDRLNASLKRLVGKFRI